MANLTETSKQPKVIAGIAGGVFLLVILMYFGLSALASSRAEDQLKAQLIEMGQPYALRWENLSSSPLGGTIKLRGVQLNIEQENPYSGKQYYQVAAESVTLKGFDSDEPPSKAEVGLEGVVFPSLTQGGGERNLLLAALNQTKAIDLFRQSGRNEVPPLNLQLAWDSKKDSLALEWSLDFAEMFSAKGKQRLEGPLRNVLADLDPERLVYRPLDALLALAMQASRIGVGQFDLEVRDQGMLKRINLLEQRYLIANREAETAKAAENQLFDQAQRNCTDFSNIFTNSDACKRFAEFFSSQRDVLKLSASGKDAVTFADFERGGEELLKLRLKPSLK